jgi:hypothetical protein
MTHITQGVKIQPILGKVYQINETKPLIKQNRIKLKSNCTFLYLHEILQKHTQVNTTVVAVNALLGYLQIKKMGFLQIFLLTTQPPPPPPDCCMLNLQSTYLTLDMGSYIIILLS